jgi:hypothetical protein
MIMIPGADVMELVNDVTELCVASLEWVSRDGSLFRFLVFNKLILLLLVGSHR